MRISWDIQRNKKRTRSKALAQAWAIVSNEDITVLYLTKRLNGNKPLPKKVEGQFSIFPTNP